MKQIEYRIIHNVGNNDLRNCFQVAGPASVSPPFGDYMCDARADGDIAAPDGVSYFANEYFGEFFNLRI